MSAAKYKADNLIAIVDQNGYQQTGATNEVLDLKPVAPKFAAFGWQAQEIDGHNLDEIHTALSQATSTKSRPSVIVARTQKGYPIQHLLGSDPNHHGKPLTAAEMQAALDYLEKN
jgi:transketolase